MSSHAHSFPQCVPVPVVLLQLMNMCGANEQTEIFSWVTDLDIHGNLEWLDKKIAGCPFNDTILKLHVPEFNVQKP